MNIITKICVVVLLVLVLVASVVFINVAVVSPNWRHHYNVEKNRRVLMEQSVRYEKLHSDRLASELKTAQGQIVALKRAVDGLKAERVASPESLLVAELKAELASANTRLTELGLTVKAQGERNKLLIAQLDDSRKLIDGLQTQNRRAGAEITQLRGSLDRSDRVVRALQRQLMDRDERIKELEDVLARGGKAPGPGARPAGAGAKITGTITALKGELASVNIGAAQGLTTGAKLYIYRKANLVGFLHVTDVDEGEAAGIIKDKQLDPVVGDKVTNNLLE